MMGHFEELDLSQVSLAPMRHERLTEELERRARAAHQDFLKVLFSDEPFEVFERNLLRDMHPGREIAATEAMAVALKLAKPKDNEQTEIAKLILVLSTLPPGTEPRRSQFTLSRRVIERVVAAWEEAKKQIGIADTAMTVMRVEGGEK